MNKAARKNFDLISFSSNCGLGDSLRISLAGLSLGVVTKQSLFDYGSKLVSLAEDAHILRQADFLEAISERLMTLSLPQFEKIGLYYKGLCLRRKGQTEESRALFESVSEKGPVSYRARAILLLGRIYLDKGNHDSAHKLFIEAQSLSCRNEYSDPLALLQSRWSFGILQSIEGDHDASTANFENLRPLVEVISSRHPSLWFEYQNSLAVELMEVGRIEEAERASRIALAYPYARLYPEWSETARDLEEKNRRASPAVVSLSNCDLPTQSISKSLPSQRSEARPIATSDNIIRLQTETRREARQAIKVAMSTPLAEAYPEWQETATELAEPISAPFIAVEVEPAAHKAEKRRIVKDHFLLALISQQARASVSDPAPDLQLCFASARIRECLIARALPRAPPLPR